MSSSSGSSSRDLQAEYLRQQSEQRAADSRARLREAELLLENEELEVQEALLRAALLAKKSKDKAESHESAEQMEPKKKRRKRIRRSSGSGSHGSAMASFSPGLPARDAPPPPPSDDDDNDDDDDDDDDDQGAVQPPGSDDDEDIATASSAAPSPPRSSGSVLLKPAPGIVLKPAPPQSKHKPATPPVPVFKNDGPRAGDVRDDGPPAEAAAEHVRDDHDDGPPAEAAQEVAAAAAEHVPDDHDDGHPAEAARAEVAAAAAEHVPDDHDDGARAAEPVQAPQLHAGVTHKARPLRPGWSPEMMARAKSIPHPGVNWAGMLRNDERQQRSAMTETLCMFKQDLRWHSSLR